MTYIWIGIGGALGSMARGWLALAVARIVGETWHRVHAICARYVDLALERADLSAVDATQSGGAS